MEFFLKARIEKLKNDLKIADKVKHSPTDKATLREQHFRQFITDLFPYYDAFKGRINGKSCDFVLADKEHPKFDSTPDNYYYSVFVALVDTVIDLKGNVTEQEFNKGWEQSFCVKSKTRATRTRSVLLNLNVNLNYLNQLMIAHGVVFINGTLNKVLKYLIKKISPSETEQEYLQLNEKNIQYFYKSPDFFYSIEENEIIFLDKTNIFSPLEIEEKNETKVLRIFKIKGENALILLVYLLENFSNMRNNMKMRENYKLEFAEQLKGFYSPEIVYFLSPEIEWVLEKTESEYKLEKTIRDKLMNLLKLKIS